MSEPSKPVANVSRPTGAPIEIAGPWITELEEKVVLDALRNGWHGKNAYYYCETFEREFAGYHGRRYALMTPNCTSAIHLLLAGLGIKDDDEVILPECTWIASAAPVSYQRAKAVFADIDPQNWCLTPATIERAITPKTKAVIVVDLYGNMPNWDEILELGKRRGLTMIEDAAEALGSVYRGRKAGSFGVGSVFSFHRTKTLTTGEGGMLLLDDEKLYERCRLLRDHGRAPFTYYNVEVAYKYMPFNLQAALGYAQFQRLDELVGKKRWILDASRRRLADIPDIQLNHEPQHVVNGVWCTALVFGESLGLDRETAIKAMQDMGLPLRPFFLPLSSLPAYPGREEEGRQNNPNSYSVSSRGVNLPSALNLTEAQIDAVCAGLHRLAGG
ncbi:MAG: DegT/DnrJ/EryC1/StrS family aminotransferase [Pseudolabrys sp.]